MSEHLTSDPMATPQTNAAAYRESLLQELENRGWRQDSRGDPECCDEASAAAAQIIRAQERRIAELELNLSSTAADLAQAQADGRALQANIMAIIDGVESRCMAADGPVTNTRHEMTDDELRRIYVLAGGRIHD